MGEDRTRLLRVVSTMHPALADGPAGAWAVSTRVDPVVGWATEGWLDAIRRLRGRGPRGRRRDGAITAMAHDEPAASRANGPGPSLDAEPFAALFDRHRDDLAHLCRRMLDDAASVDDALSEIFLRAHRAHAHYDSARPFKPWLRTLAANHCIDMLRRRRTERALFDAEELDADVAADQAPGVLALLTQREEKTQLLAALDALPAKYRLPLVLRFYRDLDYDAIAEILGVSRGQVGTLLHRAKKRLRASLASTAAVEGE